MGLPQVPVIVTHLAANRGNQHHRIEELSGIPISWIGVGPGREDMVTKGFAKQA